MKRSVLFIVLAVASHFLLVAALVRPVLGKEKSNRASSNYSTFRNQGTGNGQQFQAVSKPQATRTLPLNTTQHSGKLNTTPIRLPTSGKLPGGLGAGGSNRSNQNGGSSSSRLGIPLPGNIPVGQLGGTSGKGGKGTGSANVPPIVFPNGQWGGTGGGIIQVPPVKQPGGTVGGGKGGKLGGIDLGSIGTVPPIVFPGGGNPGGGNPGGGNPGGGNPGGGNPGGGNPGGGNPGGGNPGGGNPGGGNPGGGNPGGGNPGGGNPGGGNPGGGNPGGGNPGGGNPGGGNGGNCHPHHCLPWWSSFCFPHCDNYYPYPVYPSGTAVYYETTPIIVTTPAPTVTVAVPAAAVAEVNEPKADEVPANLLKLHAGATVAMKGTNLGTDAGQVVLQVGDLAMATQMQDWKADGVVFELPRMGVAKPTVAQLHLLRANGELIQSVPFELLPPKADEAGKGSQAGATSSP